MLAQSELIIWSLKGNMKIYEKIVRDENPLTIIEGKT